MAEMMAVMMAFVLADWMVEMMVMIVADGWVRRKDDEMVGK
jgi:hypothetical protein